MERLVTIFTVPKPFRDEVTELQVRALQSWLRLGSECEVVVLGDEVGISEVASKYGVRHVGDLECNEYGTPLLDSVMRQAEKEAAGRFLCYVNADIILTRDFTAALRCISLDRFLMIGRRWNVDPSHIPSLSDPNWEDALKRVVRLHGSLGIPDQVDYFVFTPGLWPKVPPFAIGRLMFDNWLIYAARSRRVTVIDATSSVFAVHQNHDYRHVSEGSAAAGYIAIEAGPEAIRNSQLAGGAHHAFTTRDATKVLRNERLIGLPLSGDGLFRRLDSAAILHPRAAPVFRSAHFALDVCLRMTGKTRHAVRRWRGNRLANCDGG